MASLMLIKETNGVRANTGNPWVLAARPRTLWAAVAPVAVGNGVAIGDGVFRPDALAASLVCALALQIAANFANDASDAARGADSEDRVGPIRVVASGLLPARQVWVGVGVMFTIAAGCGLYLAAIAGWAVLAVGGAALVASVTYTGGPRPYGYRAMGELFVFVFFGLVATVGSRYVHDGSLPLDVWLLAIPMGFTASAILVANNVRDIETDGAVGKRTLAVVLGAARARALYSALLLGALGSIAAWSLIGLVPPWSALSLITAPLAVPLIRTVRSSAKGPELIRVLEGTARLHLAMGVLVGLGAAIG